MSQPVHIFILPDPLQGVMKVVPNFDHDGDDIIVDSTFQVPTHKDTNTVVNSTSLDKTTEL